MKTSANLTEKFSQVQGQWIPHVLAELNDYHIKLAKIQGDFVWHSHPDTDELFYVVKGEMVLQFRDRSVTVNQGELIVVPAGVEHKPSAENECHIMMIEKNDTVNTGTVTNDRTVAELPWIN